MKIKLYLKTKRRKGIQVKILLELSDKTSVRIQSEIKTTKYYYIGISMISSLINIWGYFPLKTQAKMVCSQWHENNAIIDQMKS